MTEFKVGDHVRVEFEGVVKDAGMNNPLILVNNGLTQMWVDDKYATKVEPELPTEPFSVVEFNYAIARKTRYRAVLVGTRWYNMSDAPVEPAEMHDIRIVRVGV